MNISNEVFDGAQTILDVGGWFKPEPRATHVVDRLPWETRYGKLSLSSLPHESFTKETWFQADFLLEGFELPLPDKSMDLILCGHTLEDLADPEPIISEMQRVGKRGVIECPSRLHEQTKGIRDRESTKCGHPHHHWIVESTDDQLHFYSKADSCLELESNSLPLVFTEGNFRDHSFHVVFHFWDSEISYQIYRGEICMHAASSFVKSHKVSTYLRYKDHFFRFARRQRTRLSRSPGTDYEWWHKIIEASRPYSVIDLD